MRPRASRSYTAPAIFALAFYSHLLVTADSNGNKSDVTSNVRPNGKELLEIIVSQDPKGIEAGSTPHLICKAFEPVSSIWWTYDNKNLTSVKENDYLQRFDLKKATREDSGNYTCHVHISNSVVKKTIHIRVIEPARVAISENIRVKALNAVNLTCDFYGDPLSNYSWAKSNDSDNLERLKNMTNWMQTNETNVSLMLAIKSATRKDNGTYTCSARDFYGVVTAERHLFVIDVPLISIDFLKTVGAGSIFLNWTVNNGNEPIETYFIQYMKNGTDSWQYNSELINGGNSSFVLKGLDKGAAYQIGITAKNKVGKSHVQIDQRWITTLEKDPIFIPKLNVNGMTSSTVTIAWNNPPPDLREHIHYYIIVASHEAQTREAVVPVQQSQLYLFEYLETATTYKFKIAACNEYTRQCGNWSKEVEAETLDGVPNAPQNLSVSCRFDNISRTSLMSINWVAPQKRTGIILQYKIEINGKATFKDESGRMKNERLNPFIDHVDFQYNTFRKNQLPPNTNYTIRVSCQTRQRFYGDEAIANCTMPVTVPDRENLNARSWHKIESQGRQLFKIYLPRITERNGPICCYKIFIIKLAPQKTLVDLPPPEEISVFSYQYVYSSTLGGAYLAEMFDSNHLPPEVFIGNGESHNGSIACEQCIGLRQKSIPTLLHFIPENPTQAATNIGMSTQTSEVTPQSNIINITKFDNSTFTTSTPTINQTETSRRRREDITVAKNDYDSLSISAYDGYLDEKANYTAFVEVIVYGSVKGQFLAAYSSYLPPLYGGVDPKLVIVEDMTTLAVILQISLVLILVIIILLITLCVLHRYSKRVQQRGEEIITLRNSFRHLCQSLRGRHQLVAATPPDMPPIPKSELLQSYLERHRDSDYGFQHEFELLPDRFTDRTTRASEARENIYKNRYPDIKCYDQTRVRLAQMDGICGSDYINANFVLGYKERKKFICAQGPMENTVCDYWRMIWEQHLELVLMLTNLEEYSKTKCAKYWPDKGETKNFGDITVEHVGEYQYSDYVVRELKMTRTGERDTRKIVQYHFLVWKDFMAPEHPHAILRFVKRVNEAYSLEKGPILVHCSAGVGRTGTLVALDSLMQQLAEEGQVSIFNTVCDLRHQRNFLVQSLKQYIFIYRSLMEMGQYGDTEIAAPQLKAAVEKLRQRENGKEKCRMEEEYDKITAVLEDRKSFSVGGGEENRNKNRSELVIPYDRNRVILTPIPGKEHSTYINASFIEGYDNSESFIITQDPLESTIADFWRMISEQCISTIVMLSDLAEGPRKCPRYWPDDEVSYDHIRVRYIQSESCPYFTRRELCVSNTKVDENIVVTQYQYHGWPTVEGEVPEVTRGLIELIDQTQTNNTESSGPLAIHCNHGSDRSSMFVILSILVQQLRIEKRIDIFTTVKKLRSQRHGMISTFPQYEFLHRGIVNYLDLHNLGEGNELES
ncbi:PREDICTED: tyrosine-protein phosphatase 69D isoform X2 [Ceratosolen solmsi marchali]|uniref:protein-tyrosine-phosphatase n=1 Tax=Ceratosolen solmsi marchali TaxID=326594 RepID=A0AAJ7DYV2_9HYME|nr:PREDICTED: tyrosine-protein phosphatase 69D isoform X2 [Ceratosolen solmsi marchali]